MFEEISERFKQCLLTKEFTEDQQREVSRNIKLKQKYKYSPLQVTPNKLRVKYKWLRSEWRRYTDRVMKGSGKEPIEEPEWYKILIPIFSDTLGKVDVATSSSAVINEHGPSLQSSESDGELNDPL